MAHDRAAAVSTATARPLLVARNLLPSAASANSSSSSSSASASTTSVMSSPSSSSVSTMGGRSVVSGQRRRERKYVGDDRVTTTSSSTLSTASSVDASSATTAMSSAEAARRARRHTHHSQPDQDPKAARRRGVSSPHRQHSHSNSTSNSHQRRPRSRDASNAAVPDVVTADADIGPEKFASKVFAKTHHSTKKDPSSVTVTTESPPASPEDYSSASSGGHGSDKEDTMAGLTQQVAMKPSRMVVKRRATAPASGNNARRTSTGPTPVPSSPARQPSRSVGKPGATNSPRIGSGSPRVGTSSPGGTTSSLERWQIRLKRSVSGNSSGTDDERHGREPSSSRRLYSNHRSRQLMESPPPPDQVAATSRRRGSDSPSVDQRTRGRSTSRGSRQSPGVSGGLPPPPPPLSLSSDGQGSTTPRSLARKVPHTEDDATEGDDDSAPKPRPVRIRYETPERGMGGKREISHASLGKLIARLTDAHQYDTEFRDVFLLTYRSFCSPYDFIKKLLKRYTAVLSLCGGVDAETIEETQRLLDQITLEEESEQRSSNVTSISTARSDINTSMEANVSIMRLLSVLKFWIKESGFIDQDLMNDRKAQKKLMGFLSEIQNTSPIPSIRRHAENLLLTVAQLLSAQKQQAQQAQLTQAQAQAQVKTQSQRGAVKVPPPPTLVTSTSVSALPDKPFSRPGGDVVQDPHSAMALAMAHQLSDRGASHSRMRSQAATKLALPRSSSDPKREKSMVKLRTKNGNGDVIQLRSRSIPAGAEDQAIAAAATRDRMQRNAAQQQQGIVPSAAAVAPKIARGITTGSAEAAIKANANGNGAGGFDEIIQDTLQRARLTAASRKSARISYDNVEPLSGLSAQELADQLTLMEADQYFSKLNQRELTNKAWTRENKHREAPHVMALIELFDATAEWVSSEILHPQLQAVERAKMITLFIDAADNCYQMNNFNTLFEITTGLSAPCIRQLNTTWSLVSAAAQEKYQCLQQVVSPDDNYRSYRQAFALAEGQPRLACWFILVKDLFTYEEAMKSMEDGLVNWQKFRKIYRVISEALDRQNFNYVPASSSGTGTNGGNVANGGGVSRKGRGILRHDRKTQFHIRHRVDTIRKDSSVLYQLARNANTQESILFVNSLSEAGFL